MAAVGLCSVTLRQLAPEAVVSAAVRAQLTSIEWGSDVHAPAENLGLVTRCREACAGAGIRVASYGSYWKAGISPVEDGVRLLDAAQLLGASRMRVWAGEVGSEQADTATWGAVTHSLAQLAGVADDRGVSIAVEHHPGTLSDTAATTLRLLEEVGSETVSTYWQPNVGQPASEALRELGELLDHAPERLSAIHVFAWWPGYERHPLHTRADLWRPALKAVRDQARQADVMLEFVPEDAVEALVSEAATLNSWLTG